MVILDENGPEVPTQRAMEMVVLAMMMNLTARLAQVRIALQTVKRRFADENRGGLGAGTAGLPTGFPNYDSV